MTKHFHVVTPHEFLKLIANLIPSMSLRSENSTLMYFSIAQGDTTWYTPNFSTEAEYLEFKRRIEIIEANWGKE